MARIAEGWEALFIRMKNVAAGYSQHADENGSTRKLDREYGDLVEQANELRLLEAAEPTGEQKDV